MLKGIDPLLTPELLQALAAMGHGDTIAIVDANFPAASTGPPVLRLPGATAPAAADAVLSLLPLDDFAPAAAWSMEVVGGGAEPPVVGELRAAVARREPGGGFALVPLERFAFYAEAARAFCVVATGETRLYGNLLLKKGVVKGAG